MAQALLNEDEEDFGLECLGILGNLTIPDLDYELILKEYDMIPWIKNRLEPGMVYCFTVALHNTKRRISAFAHDIHLSNVMFRDKVYKSKPLLICTYMCSDVDYNLKLIIYFASSC